MSKKQKWFDLEKHLDEYIPDWKDRTLLCFLAAPRNIGKSYSGWKLAENRYLVPSSRTAYLRILDTQLKLPKREFNSRFKDKYIVAGDVIYGMHKETFENKKGEQIEVIKKDDIVGYFLSINNYINAKSNEFPNVKFIFIDEIIEDSANITGIYAKISNLLTTIIRNKQKVLICMIANRDTANNDFMVKWGIEPRDDNDLYDDVMYQISDNIYYFELGDKWYKAVDNDKTIFHEFAQFDKSSSRQLNGGYAKDFSRNVKNFDRWIKKTWKPKFSLVINKIRYYFGTFIMNNKEMHAFVDQEEFFDLTIPNYAMDSFSGLDNDNYLIDKSDILDLWEMTYFKIRNKQVIYNSFDTMLIIEESLKLFYRLRENKK